MGELVKGDVVVVPFPFSNLSNFKKRPALVLANLKDEDLILSQITSQNIFDSYSINIGSDDMRNGNLNMNSNVRPNKIFTADKNIVLYKIGSLNDEKLKEVINKIIEIFKMN